MLALPFRRVLLDGELVAHGPDGRPDFAALMRTAARDDASLVYWAFDLLHCNGRDTRQLPLEQRKHRLTEAWPVRHCPA